MKEKIQSMRPVRIIPLSFLAVILLGTLLLLLPFSTAAGERTDLLTAAFTATTSVCVTGLVVVDTYAHWSVFGKIVILFLIQLGGLGIITVVSALMLILKKHISLRSRILIHDSFNLTSTRGLLRFLMRVMRATFLVEGLGALCYMTAFIPKYGWIRGTAQSVFTSISAFCNAGIDVMGPDSLISWQTQPVVLITTMLLIVLGGLGYIVWFDLSKGFLVRTRRKKDPSAGVWHMGEHTKIVLAFTFVLIAGGALWVLLCEWNNPGTFGSMGDGGKVLNALFQSVTFRTAGFAAVSQKALTQGSVVLGCLLMFIGGSPVGTAGGVKTVVFLIVLANAASFIQDDDETVLVRRQVSKDLIRKANAIVTVSFLVILVMLMALSLTDHAPMEDLVYEVVSAVCTVGLSRNLTPLLSPAGKIVIMICMYLGRIGPISMALFFGGKDAGKKTSCVKGNFVVG